MTHPASASEDSFDGGVQRLDGPPARAGGRVIPRTLEPFPPRFSHHRVRWNDEVGTFDHVSRVSGDLDASGSCPGSSGRYVVRADVSDLTVLNGRTGVPSF